MTLPTLPPSGGGSSDYYRCDIKDPTTTSQPPYTAECNDVIEALQMTSTEANIFKAIWRRCAARTLGKLKSSDYAPRYDTDKILFFAERLKLLTDREAAELSQRGEVVVSAEVVAAPAPTPDPDPQLSLDFDAPAEEGSTPLEHFCELAFYQTDASPSPPMYSSKTGKVLDQLIVELLNSWTHRKVVYYDGKKVSRFRTHLEPKIWKRLSV